MKRSPTIDEIRKSTIKAYHEMKWFKYSLVKYNEEKFITQMNEYFKKMRRMSIFFTKFTYNTKITDQQLEAEYERLSNPVISPGMRMGIDSNTIQIINQIVCTMTSQPTLFAYCIYEYFKGGKKAKELYVFAHITFPQLYGYFIIPEMQNYTVALIKSLMCYDDQELIGHFIAAFYENTPLFLENLFDQYEEMAFIENQKNPMKLYNIFIEALEQASNLLSTYHNQLALAVYNIGNKFFNKTFIDKLFIPQFKLRSLNYECQTLIQVFKFISYYDGTAPYTIFARALIRERNYQENILVTYGGFKPVNLLYYSFYTSGYEINLFLNLTDNKMKEMNNQEMLKRCSAESLKQFITFETKIYPTLENLPKPSKLSIFDPFKKAIFKRENEDFARGYYSIRNFALKNEIDPIWFYVPDLTQSNSNKQVIKDIMKRTQWEGNQDFYKFSYSKLSNEFAENANSFETVLTLKSYCKYMNQLINSVDSLFSSQFFIYKNNNNFKSGDFALSRKFVELNKIDSDSLQYNLQSFKQVYNSLNDLDITNIESLSRLTIIINHLLSNSTPYSYRVRKLPQFFESIYFLACGLGKDSLEQNKYFFKILYSLVTDWKALFDTFCIYYQGVHDEISEKSYFGKNIKKSWELLRHCFEKVVFENSPDIETFFYNIINSVM
ncbi:hypothetical protein TRFO_41559 [Tritrichomonas foetus]|uniref:Uncharacterized protein n=1 Tax=Tritrichomonas foetus TaxID=1144522 RepID=A0A1J4L047_9EUKA|nr:hypothetical protein TRFO_41559 [Tritrichomonas foetus]|eukprot:OHT16786.1 hypothetical protein TRFO_41559 [Tritrichomonas foetus]